MAYREYSPEELRQMQLEAAQRVREMQRQARQRLEGSQQVYSSRSAPPAPPRMEAGIREEQAVFHQTPVAPNSHSPSSPTAARQQMPAAGNMLGLSGLMGMDGDRLTILLLTLLLSSQGQCSPGLMAALFWLMAD